MKSGSKVLITGATSGIGEALARALHEKGVSLLLTGRNREKLALLEKELSAKTLALDLGEDRRRLIAWLAEEKPDCLINNAGLGLYGPISEKNTADLLKLLRVNCEALTELSIEMVKIWKKHHIAGTLVNISSASAFLPLPTMAVYAATKAYVNSFSLSLGQEVKDDHIRVLAVCPGMVDTPFSERASGKKRRPPNLLTLTTQEVVEAILQQIESGKQILIIDWRYRLLLFFASLAPRALVGYFCRRFVARGSKPVK